MLEKCKISGFADEIDADLEKQIKLLNHLNQSYIEFRSANKKGVADYSIEEAMEVKKLLDSYGIKVSAIGSPIGKISITDDFTAHFETYQHVVQIAKIFDTPYIRMFSFFIPQGENPLNYKDEVYNRIRQLIECAREQDIILLHENEKDIYGDNEIRCFELMSEFYGEHFKCTFDFANFVQCKVNTMQAYQLLKPYIHYVHVKDALFDTGEVVPPGQGDGQLEDILRDMELSGYQGFLSMEPHLADFTGLHNLERNVQERKMSDGEAAYLLAYQEFQKLLKYKHR
jgi:sugar phosphate isomerase/epimerase